MTERFLQYIWQFQYFNRNELLTTDGEKVVIVHQGTFNAHQGPDFLEARIRIGNNTWIGNVELHLKSSDWDRHSHSEDPNYENVILHVVYRDDRKESDTKIALIELEHRVSGRLLEQYQGWMQNDNFVPCAQLMNVPDNAVWEFWKERLLIERLLRKAEMISGFLKQNNHHWEETLWWLLARNFGIRVNADAFAEVAMSIPFQLVLRFSSTLTQLEALLFGQAGLLEDDREDADDEYRLLLKKEYAFAAKKYGLQPASIRMLFLRMRPACFPTVRMAQLAALMHRSVHLFRVLLDENNIRQVRSMLDVTASSYWDTHFVFGEASGASPKKLGAQMTGNIIVNTIVPLLFAYGGYHHEERYRNKALEWIRYVAPEKNAYTTKFENCGVTNKCAGDSQALIELKTQYCDHRRCLDCAVGNAILKRKAPLVMPVFSS